MPADAPRTTPPTSPYASGSSELPSPVSERLAREQLVAALRDALGARGASAQQMRDIRAAADQVKAGKTGDVEQDADPATQLSTIGTAVAKAVAGHLVFALHLRMLLRGLAELGVPIRDPRWRTCLGIAVGFSVSARAVYAAVHGESIGPTETVTVTGESPNEALADGLRRVKATGGLRHSNR
jgi:hypothetical protein